MKTTLKFLSAFLLAAVAVALYTVPEGAVPQLPSSFYGKVKAGGANVPDGTVIQALIGGHVYAQTVSQTYAGDSVYALDVPGDDTGTPQKDGGSEGELIQFMVGGSVAAQTGSWNSGTNASLDLSVSGASLNTPQPTRAPSPTWTDALAPQASLTPIPPTPPAAQTPPRPTATAEPSIAPGPTETTYTPSGQTAAAQNPPTQAAAAQGSQFQDLIHSSTGMVFAIVIGLTTVCCGVLLVLQKKNPR